MAKPKTAYELLNNVCKAILRQPKQYYQNEFCLTPAERKSSMYLYNDNEIKELCGTAFCRAGFVVVEHDGYKAKPRDWEDRAEEILNINEASGDTAQDWQRLVQASFFNAKPGTRDYAREDVRGVRAFMKDHKPFLSRTLLPKR